MLLILIIMLCLPNLSQCAPFCRIAGTFPGEEKREKTQTPPRRVKKKIEWKIWRRGIKGRDITLLTGRNSSKMLMSCQSIKLRIAQKNSFSLQRYSYWENWKTKLVAKRRWTGRDVWRWTPNQGVPWDSSVCCLKAGELKGKQYCTNQ